MQRQEGGCAEFSEAFQADVKLEPGSRLPMREEHEVRGIYIVEGSVSIAGRAFAASQMVVSLSGGRITVRPATKAHG